MGSKVVVSMISIILVVGVVIGVVAVVNRGSGNSGSNNGNGNGGGNNLSTSTKTVDALCAPSTYKDACVKSLGSVSQNESATPQDYIKAGVKMALDEISKANNLTDSLLPKANGTKNPERTNVAINSCKNLFDIAVDRLDEALNHAGESKVYKDKDMVLSLRLWLTDVVTFASTCVDEFDEEEAGELKKIMKDGVVNATELTVSMLDIITTFNEALSEMGISLNNLTELSNSITSSGGAAAGRRRLLNDMGIDDEGYPTWLSTADRRILGAKKKDGKAKKGLKKAQKGLKKGKTGAAVGAGAAAGAGVAAGAGTESIPPPVTPGMKPNAVVAQDGSGQFKTIMEAVNAHPGKALQGRYVVYVKAGIYKEDVVVGKQHVNVFMYGDGPRKTIITGNKNVASKKYTTSNSASCVVEGKGFFAKDMGFQNTAGPEGEQAVALRVNALQAVFQNCWFDGYQDTLYPQGGSQFFRDCEIAGTVDFIFGNGVTLIQNSKIVAKKGRVSDHQSNLLTAQGGAAEREPTAIVIQGCEILPDPELAPVKFEFKTYLGRPWKPYAKTVFMENTIGDLIQPQGYMPWGNGENINTCFYGEYANRGPGSNTAQRIKWKNVRVLNKAEAQRYAAATFLGGGQWVNTAGVPLNLNIA